MAVRPIARLGALDSKAVFDSSSFSRRKNSRDVVYYNKPQNEGDDCILEHEVLLSSRDGADYDGDKEMRVFSSLNGIGTIDGLDHKMSDSAAILCMKDKMRYAGVSVTDFISMKGSYAPEEGRHLTITHGGLNTIHAPVEPLRAGDMLAVDFPTREQAHKMRRRRGASNNKVTAIVKRYQPYSVGDRTKRAIQTMLTDTTGIRQTSPHTYDKWNKTGQKLLDSYLYGAIQLQRILGSSGLSPDDLETRFGFDGSQPTQEGTRQRKMFAARVFGLDSSFNNMTKGSSGIGATHFADAVGTMADAIEEDRRWVIGKCTTGCKEGGYATCALGLR